RRSRLRLRPEPRSANGGIDVAESDISKAAVRGKQSRRRKWLATAVPARARARAGDLSRQFRWRFPPPSRAAPGGAQPAYGRWPPLRLPIKNAISRRVCPLQMFIYICQYVTLEQIVCNIDSGLRGAPHVPLFAAGLALPATVAILVAVCRWPSQRLAKGAGRSNWSSTRATMWLTMSSTVCGWL